VSSSARESDVGLVCCCDESMQSAVWLGTAHRGVAAKVLMLHR
jgi:hypothetical protein